MELTPRGKLSRVKDVLKKRRNQIMIKVTTKNNSKDGSSSRSSKSNSTNKTPIRKPSIKLCQVKPKTDEVKVVQVPNAFDKKDKDDMSTVSSSSNEQGYFSSSSQD